MTHWQHIMIGSRCSWLPGDERGFRNREHRLHSSGDYKNRPPKTEHEGLRKYHQRRAGKPVNFRTGARIIIVREFVLKMRSLGLNVIACALGKRHLHALVMLPNNYNEMRAIVGKCNQKASHAVRDLLPGTIWAEGGEYVRIRDKKHLHNTYDYIRTKQEPGMVVWSHKPGENWIDDPSVGVIIMGRNCAHIRVFGVPQTPAFGNSAHSQTPASENSAHPQTPASEVLRRPGSGDVER